MADETDAEQLDRRRLNVQLERWQSRYFTAQATLRIRSAHREFADAVTAFWNRYPKDQLITGYLFIDRPHLGVPEISVSGHHLHQREEPGMGIAIPGVTQVRRPRSQAEIERGQHLIDWQTKRSQHRNEISTLDAKHLRQAEEIWRSEGESILLASIDHHDGDFTSKLYICGPKRLIAFRGTLYTADVTAEMENWAPRRR